MPIFWDDIELLALTYALHEAGGLHHRSGDQLMQEMGGSAGIDADRAAFVRTLHVMAQDELIAFELLIHGLVSAPRPESYEYLAHLRNFAIRTRGLDRARGIKIVDPPPEPGEDDGRSIPGLIIKDIAVSIQQAVGGQDDFRRELEFLAESGISPENFPGTVSGEDGQARQTMEQLHRGSSAQRRELRQFIAGWLEGALYAAPSAAEHKKVVDALARQGWFVKDGRLVIGEPVRGANRVSGDTARDVRIAALHPVIRDVAQRPFEAGEPAAAVFEAFKAVNKQVRELSSSDEDGQPLMARVFRPESPVLCLADLGDETGRNVQAGYHHMFMGAMRGIRNLYAHGHFPELDENQALEQLGFASLLMRRLDDATGGEG